MDDLISAIEADDAATEEVVEETPYTPDTDFSEEGDTTGLFTDLLGEPAEADEEGDAQDAQDIQDAPAADATEAEDADADEDAEEQAEPQSIAAAIADLLPGRVIETDDDARAAIGTLEEASRVLGDFNALIEGDEAALAYLAARREGVPARQAAFRAFGDLAAIPDADEDPEAYAAYAAEQARAEVRGEFDAKEQAKQAAAQQRRMEDEQRALTAFAQARGETFDAGAYAAEVRALLFGDPDTGRVRSDKYEVIFNGLNHKRLVEEAVQAARAEGEKAGRTAAVKDLKAARKGKADGLPTLTSGGSAQRPAPEGVERFLSSTPPDVISSRF